MNQITLAFVANDGNAYAPDTEIGKQLGYITWTPSKLRIERVHKTNEEIKVTLEQQSELLDKSSLPQDIQEKYAGKIVTPRVLFYENEDAIRTKTFSETIEVTIPKDKDYIDIYVGGKFQPGMLYCGASPEKKDIEITAIWNGEKSSILTMIRVRRNANELTSKAKEDFVHALSNINQLIDEETGTIIPNTMGKGIYSTDFYNMHVSGAVAMGHGDSMFLPWHRLFLLDVERQLQKILPQVTLHYWKFDEKAPNLFKDDFLGETISYSPDNQILTEGLTDCFAKFNNNNPLKKWAIGNEKLLRRQSFFDNQHKSSNTDVLVGVEGHMISEQDTMNLGIVLGEFNPNEKDRFTNMEITPHGAAHISFNGPLNNVPTAVKDPIFFFIHCQVDHLWAKWQNINNRFDINSEDTYPYQLQKKEIDDKGLERIIPNGDWKLINSTQWPWDYSKGKPGDLLPPGTRAYFGFTKSYDCKNFNHNIPRIADSIDAFGKINIDSKLGFDYADTAAFLEKYVNPTTQNPDPFTVKIENSYFKKDLQPDVLENTQQVDQLLTSLRTINKLFLEFRNKRKSNNLEDIVKNIMSITESTYISDAKLLNRIKAFQSNIKSLKETFISSELNFDPYKELEKIIGEIAKANLNIVSFNAIFPVVFQNKLPEINNEIYQLLIKIEENNLVDKNQDLVNKLYIYLAYQNHTDVIFKLEKMFGEQIYDMYNQQSISNYLIIYLLFANNEKSYSDTLIKETVKNNIKYFSNIEIKEVIDAKIALYSFASNDTIREKIIPLFLPNKEALESYLIDLENKSKGSDSLSNKYWALHTLLTNAGVGVNN